MSDDDLDMQDFDETDMAKAMAAEEEPEEILADDGGPDHGARAGSGLRHSGAGVGRRQVQHAGQPAP